MKMYLYIVINIYNTLFDYHSLPHRLSVKFHLYAQVLHKKKEIRKSEKSLRSSLTNHISDVKYTPECSKLTHNVRLKKHVQKNIK